MKTIIFFLILQILLLPLFFYLRTIIHELGHFIAAKGFGLTVNRFSIGEGKTIFTFIWRETTFSIALDGSSGYIHTKETEEEIEKSKLILLLLAGPFASLCFVLILFSFSLAGHFYLMFFTLCALYDFLRNILFNFDEDSNMGIIRRKLNERKVCH